MKVGGWSHARRSLCTAQMVGVFIAQDTWSVIFVFPHLTSATLWGSLLHLTVREQVGRGQVTQESA